MEWWIMLGRGCRSAAAQLVVSPAPAACTPDAHHAHGSKGQVQILQKLHLTTMNLWYKYHTTHLSLSLSLWFVYCFDLFIQSNSKYILCNKPLCNMLFGICPDLPTTCFHSLRHGDTMVTLVRSHLQPHAARRGEKHRHINSQPSVCSPVHRTPLEDAMRHPSLLDQSRSPAWAKDGIYKAHIYIYIYTRIHSHSLCMSFPCLINPCSLPSLVRLPKDWSSLWRFSFTWYHVKDCQDTQSKVGTSIRHKAQKRTM